jgi:hypothetical protein
MLPKMDLEKELVLKEFPKIPLNVLNNLLQFKFLLETKGKDANLGILSLRSLFRICKRLQSSEGELYDQIKRSLLMDFLPKSQRDLLRVLLMEANIIVRLIEINTLNSLTPKGKIIK